MATVIESTMMVSSMVCHCEIIGPNTFIMMTMSVNAAAPFDTTERYPVTGVGAP